MSFPEIQRAAGVAEVMTNSKTDLAQGAQARMDALDAEADKVRETYAEMRKSTVALKYEGGHPRLPQRRDVAVGKTDTQLVIYDPRSWDALVEIPKDSIVGVGMDKDVVRYRSVGRAVAGAVIAGALTFGVGTLAGALIGGRRRKKDESTIDMVVKVGKAEVTISFSGKNIRQRYAEFAALLE